MILSLVNCCRESLAKAMSYRLVNENDVTETQNLLYSFIAENSLPQNIVMSILKAFILTLDRRGIPFSGRVVDCKTTCRNRGWAETTHSRDCSLHESNQNDGDKRFRMMSLVRYSINVVMTIWSKNRFSPACLVEENLPIGLSLRMRQWILMHAVDGFLKCHNICQPPFPRSECRSHVESGTSNEHGLVYYQRCPSCSVQHHQEEFKLNEVMTSIYRRRGVKNYPTILDLRTWKGNIHCTRAALTALKLALEKVSETEDVTSQSKQTTQEDGDLKVVTIKLEVAVVGSMHDWFSDVLLTVLRKARMNGLRIDLSAIRFEDVTPSTMASIIRNLSSPTEVRQLHFKHVDPLSMLDAKESLRVLTGVEEFSLATCDFQPVHFSAEETSILWGEIISSWPKIRSLEFSGIRMCFNNNIDKNNNKSINLPTTLRSLELADESITADILGWISEQKIENESEYSGDLKSFSLQALRVVREASLARQPVLWDLFLNVVNKLKHTLKTLSVDHCNLTSSHTLDILESLTPEQNSEYASSLRRLTLREPHVTWKTTLELFSCILTISPTRLFNPNSEEKTYLNFPTLTYFSAMVPKASDTTISGVTEVEIDPYYFTKNWTENPRSHFEDKLIKMATDAGRSRINAELIWEPECDWT